MRAAWRVTNETKMMSLETKSRKGDLLGLMSSVFVLLEVRGNAGFGVLILIRPSHSHIVLILPGGNNLGSA